MQFGQSFRLECVASGNSEKELLWGYMLAPEFASSLVNNKSVLRQILVVVPFSFAAMVLVNLRIWVCVVTVGSGLGGIALTVLLPLQKHLKMKLTAKLATCKLSIFACISEYGYEREEAPVPAYHLFSVSSSTLRSESFIAMDSFVFSFCASFCKSPWLRLVCESCLWEGYLCVTHQV